MFFCLILLTFSACTADQPVDESRSKNQQEDSNAQYKLGLKYYCGQGVPKNNLEAMKYFKKAAEQGHVDAQYQLGKMYEYDVEIPAEQEAMESRGVYTINEDSGMENSQNAKNFLVAMGKLMRDFHQNQAAAVKWYKKAASQGHADAQYKVGMNYALGSGGLNEDYNKAAKWWKKAAKQGQASAQYELGGMYYIGEGVSQNYHEALKLFDKAAEQGIPMANYKLGVMYYKGQGTPQDFVKAYPHFYVAAMLNKKNARNLQAIIEKKISSAQTLEGKKKANILLNKVLCKYPGYKNEIKTPTKS